MLWHTPFHNLKLARYVSEVITSRALMYSILIPYGITKLLYIGSVNGLLPDSTKQLPKPMLIRMVKLTHWGRVTHICISKLRIIGSDNGLSPKCCQAIICTSAGILLIRTLGTNFTEILSESHIFSLKKMHLKTLSGKWQPFCLGLNVLNSKLHS